MSDFTVPDSIKPLTGWRAWQVKRMGGKAHLVSMHYGGEWPHREKLEAKCPLPSCPAKKSQRGGVLVADKSRPLPKACHCGVHAWKDRSRAERDAKYYAIYGEIKMWGQVIEHKDGYRTQFAYPKELFFVRDTPQNRQLAKELAENYGIPVHVGKNTVTKNDGNTQQFPGALQHPEIILPAVIIAGALLAAGGALLIEKNRKNKRTTVQNSDDAKQDS